MKKLHYILFLLLPVSVFAQTKDSVVTRNVTVEREYVPVVKNPGKVSSAPQVIDSKKTKTEAQYTEFNLPVPIGYAVHTLPPARLVQSQAEAREGFAQLGLGTYPNTLLDFAYPLLKRSDAQLDFTLRHRGAFGYELYSKSIANLQFNKQFDLFDLFMGINGGHDYLSYYGKTFDKALNAQPKNSDPTRESKLRTGAYAGFQSPEEPYEWHYRAKISYDLFNAVKNSSLEHTVTTSGGLSTAFDEDRIGGDINLQNMIYSSVGNVPNSMNNYSVLKLDPYYLMRRSEDWTLRLGIKAAFSMGLGQAVNLSPDVRFDWKPIPQWLGVYGGLTGDYKVNNQNSMFDENPYLTFDSQIKNTFTPFEFFGGVKIKPLSNFFVDIFANYRYINNQYFFENKIITRTQDPALVFGDTIYTNRFDVLYSKAKHFKTGIRLNYTYQNRLNVQLKGAYNDWNMFNNDAYAWLQPMWEMDFNTSFNVTKELAFSLNAFYESERHAKLGNYSRAMDPKLDINIGASYTYLDWLTFFARANNLLNNRYENFYGYRVQGLNAMVGASVSF